MSKIIRKRFTLEITEKEYETIVANADKSKMTVEEFIAEMAVKKIGSWGRSTKRAEYKVEKLIAEKEKNNG